VPKVRAKPCSSCPYRRDVPSGVWDYDEYEKLRPYDAETPQQPFNGFSCHATPEYYCNGWALCHTSRGHTYDLIALRFDPETAGGELPEPHVPLFGSAAEAADHGQRECAAPGDGAVAAIEKLTRQHARLR
jgi:Family of unknown function (DUF6283)